MSILLFLSLAVSGASLYLEDATVRIGGLSLLTNYLELAVVLFLLVEIIVLLGSSRWQLVFLRRRLLPIVTALLVLAVLVLSKFVSFSFFGIYSSRNAILLVVIRNIVLLVLALRRVKGLLEFLEYLRDHPAQTIILSFLLVIISGTVLLMMPFTSQVGQGLSFVNALFTSTSAVCVTGLTVVDTATSFSFAGKLVLLLLIQIGGLGIMLLTFFTMFVLRRSLSVENKLLISYLLSEQDMTRLREMVLKIIYITFSIEGAGAVLLFVGFAKLYGVGSTALFYAVFHSISAFCNAGFALYSSSLEGFVANPWISGTISALIILGGLSFVVLIDLGQNLVDRVGAYLNGGRRRVRRLSLNSRVILTVSVLLIFGGMLLIYALEHGNVLRRYPTGTQYFAAFFQSVTLRTAGFNSIPFGSLRTGTYLVMCVFMFIGGASGSTAGGIKMGTVAVIYASVASFFRNRRSAVLFQQSIPSESVLRAFVILVFGVLVVGTASIVLSLSEHQPAIKIVFEATSAFGTVGLSTGITPQLSVVGRVLVSLLMFAGRIGTLTVIAAASREGERGHVEYPTGEISIG